MTYDTREDEKPCICGGCDNDPHVCGENAEDCLQSMADAAAEERRDALRDA
jgi:hypothetical protein